MSGEEQQTLANFILNQSTEKWIIYASQLSKYISSEEIRIRILAFFSTNPKGIQNACEKIKSLFYEDFFEKILQNPQNIDEKHIVSLFLLFHSFKLVNAYHGRMKTILESRMENIQPTKAIIVEEKEKDPFGMACGGMENNYTSASLKDTGLCLVNKQFIAKFHHERMDKPIKVSLLPIQTYMSANGFVIWEDFFYAPSGGAHTEIIKAIENNDKYINIDNLKLKYIRPTFNGVTSRSIYENTKHLFEKYMESSD